MPGWGGGVPGPGGVVCLVGWGVSAPGGVPCLGGSALGGLLQGGVPGPGGVYPSMHGGRHPPPSPCGQNS